ncbi:sodium channel protein Nach-like [Hyposmocoma kahamanoa]|uniref:sodium channel protein Nach-like n=1 Tax=Hyposmocoma kahamanoa TaxID=1477025 RepID=UPI000E6D6256|nr:sodium channel protein Nach-like [Hyposmocoma kahamanoa]
MFNDWTEFPVDKNSALVSYNTETYHSICATYTYCSDDVKKLSPESRNCLFSDELRPQYFHGYHNSDCDMMCQVHTIEQQCNCVLPFVPHVRKQVACNLTSLPCVVETRMQMQHLLQKKHCDCLGDCDFREYTVDITAGNLDGISYSFTTDFLYHMNVNKSTSLMNFIFLTPSYVKQRQETVMSITTLFSNIGGVIGLCLGCSLVTVVEIFFYLYVCLRNCFIKNIRKVKKPYREHYYSFHM